MVIPTCGDEGRARAQALCQLETEHVAVEAQCAIKVRDLEMHVADANLWMDRHVTPPTPQSVPGGGCGLW